MINVAIIGHGVVGSGVAEILINHRDRVSKRAKNEINVKYILDIRDLTVLDILTNLQRILILFSTTLKLRLL